MADIFQEVEEDLKRERLEALWKKYGTWVIGAAVAVVAATAGYQGWQSYQQSVREERSALYDSALEQSESAQGEQARTLLGELAAEDDGYGTLARFEQARLLAEEGKIAEAVTLWDRIAESSPPVERLKDVAAFLAASSLVENGELEEAKARLAKLAVAGQPFQYSALELQGVVALEEGDKTSARAFFKQLAEDREAPAGIRGRASQIVKSLAE